MSDNVDYGARALTLRNRDLPRVWSINQSIQYLLLPRPWSRGSSPANNIHPENRIRSFWRFVAWNCSNNRKRIWSGAFQHPVGSSSRSNSLVDMIDTCWHIWGCLQECFFYDTECSDTHTGCLKECSNTTKCLNTIWSLKDCQDMSNVVKVLQPGSFLHRVITWLCSSNCYMQSCAALLEFFLDGNPSSSHLYCESERARKRSVGFIILCISFH